MYRSCLIAAAIIVLSSLVFVGILIVAMTMEGDWVLVMRDPVDPSRHPLAGLLSHLGIAVLGGATLFYLLRLSRQGPWTALTILTAALPSLMILDDLLMLHEGTFEIAFYGIYALAGASLMGLQLLRAPSGSVLLIAAVTFLAFSVAVDFGSSDPTQQVFGVSYWKLRAVLEDLFKFIGYALFAGHLLQGGHAMRQPRFEQVRAQAGVARMGRAIE